MLENLRGLYRYRQLITALTARDLKARYRGSVLGFFWSLANPLLLLTVYTLVFSLFFRRPDISPYPIFLFVGILPWTFFAASTLESTGAITANAALVKKVMFPSEALALVVVFSHLAHFIFALPVLLAAIFIAVIAGLMPLSPWIALAPVIILLQTVFISGIALALSSTSVLFRDLRDLVTNLLQLGFFLTPVIYRIDSAPSKWVKVLLRINPMTPFVTSYQNIFFFNRPPSVVDGTLMVLYAALSATIGFVVFDRLRDTLAEAI
jgi:lipopolysaccharide transport system permease protein